MRSRFFRLLRLLLAALMVLGLVPAAPSVAVAEPIGGLLWERSSAPGSAPFDVAVDSDGSYFVACPGSSSVEKFAADGTHLWTLNVAAGFESYTAHLDVDETGLYINIEHGSVAKLDKADGSVLWTASGLPIADRVVADVSVYDGVLYATQPGLTDSWFMLDATTGAYQAPVGYSTPHPEDAFYYVEVDSTGIYIWCNDLMLRRLDFERNVVWEVSLENAGGMALGGDGYIYVPDDSAGIVNKISIEDGSIAGTLYGQDGCLGAGYFDGVLYTTSSSYDVVRTYAEPWPDPTAPQAITGLTSPTHPDQEAVYPEDSPGFTWDYSSEKLYSWVIDQDPEGEPDLTADDVKQAGTSPLGSAVRYPALTSPQSIVSGDFDEDGALDLAVGSDDDEYGVTIHLNNGDGTFEEAEEALDASVFAPGTYADSLVVADMDSDGHLDIAFYDESALTIGILWGAGDGTFTYASHPTIGGEYVLGITVGDFDSQAGLDIAVNFDGLDHIEVWKSRAGDVREYDTSTVTLPEGSLGYRCITAVDLNEDGCAELIIATDLGSLMVATNDGTGVFTTEQMSVAATLADESSIRTIHSADVNDDGHADVIASNSYSLKVLLGDGTGGLSESFDAVPYYEDQDRYVYPRAFAVGDINGDGALDLSFGDDDTNEVVALTGNGDGTFEHAGGVEVDSMRRMGIDSADYDGDGRADVVIAGYSEMHVLMGVEPTPYNVLSEPLEDGSWFFHVREVNEKDGEWRGGPVSTFRVGIGELSVVQDQTIDNGLIKVTVAPEGRPSAYVWSGSEWVYQYYSEDAWGTVLWLDGEGYTNGYADGIVFTPVSNEIETFEDGKRIVTVYDAGETGVRVTQTFTIIDGERTIEKDWRVEALSGTFVSVRLYHGGDTYFGGEDSASSYYDTAKSMVYVRNNEFTDWGIMGFYANPATPADHYYGGAYGDGNDYAQGNENLPDTVDPEFRDAGYYLQWDKRGGLSPEDSVWDILAYEVWTPGGALQVLAPGSQNVLPGSTVVLPFALHNISEVPQDVTLTVECDDPAWSVEIVGDTTPDVGATVRVPVPVRVTVPEGATGDARITLHVDGPEADGSGATRLSVVDLDFDVAPASAELQTWPGGITQQTITITNGSEDVIKLGKIALSNRESYNNGEGDGDYLEIAPGGSASFDVSFGADEPGTYACTVSIPIVSPLLVTATVQLSGVCSEQPELSSDPNPVRFSALAGEQAWSDVTITNDSAYPVQLGTLSVPEPFSLGEHSADGATLGAGETITVPVGFYLAVSGESSETLTVPITAPVAATASFQLIGECVYGETELSVQPGSVDLEALTGDCVWQDVIITNDSSHAIDLGTLSVPEPFVLGEHSADGATLAAGASITVPVGVCSDEPGEFSGELDVPVTHPAETHLLVSVSATVRVDVPSTVEVEGVNRYATSIAACQEAFPEGAPTVVIATGEQFPDALGGSALAGVLDAPLLLTTPNMLIEPVKAEIDRLGATRVYVLGGEGALSSSVFRALSTLLGSDNVIRIGGIDRYATAELVAAEVIRLRGAEFDGQAFVATGADFADALACSPVAAATGRPIYLAKQPVISASTIAAMKGAGVTEVTLLGGTGAVSDGSRIGLEAAGMSATRIGGQDRYETAALIAAHGVSEEGLSWDGLGVARGDVFADALVGGAAVGRHGSVMLLVQSTVLPDATGAALDAQAGSVRSVRFFGGLGAITQTVRDEVLARL